MTWKIKAMLLGHIYQMVDGSFHVVNMKAALNKYMEQTKVVLSDTGDIVSDGTLKERIGTDTER